MPEKAFTPTEEQIASIDPDSGPWEVKIKHRLFRYTPLAKPDGRPSGFAFASRGDTISLLHLDDLQRGLRRGAFVDPTASADDPTGEGPGDFNARADLVEFVKGHKVDDVLAKAGSDPDMAQLLLDAELEAKPKDGEPRKGVLSGLQAVIDAYLDPAHPADPPLAPLGSDAPVTDPGDENEDGDDEGSHSEEE